MTGLVEVEGAAGEAAEDGVEFAEAAVADHFAGFAEAGVGALLAAGLEDAVVFGDGGDHGAAFGDREGAGFFAVDIPAGADGLDGGDGVPVVGKGDEDGVDIGASEDVAEVFVGGAAFVGAGALFAGVVPFDEVAGGFAAGKGTVPVAGGLAVDVADGED